MPSLWISTPSGQKPIALESAGYATEAEFQTMLADNPALLAGALASGDDNAAWLLIDREISIRAENSDVGTWSLDHLFIDPSGRPVLVEVKRSGDPRARREVVAQMLDYAASFSVDWNAEALQLRWEQRVAKSNSEDEMDAFLESTAFDDQEQLWREVETHIEAGQLRLLFVADRLSPTLIRIIEFLNEQMRTTEILGVEVARHASSSDEGLVAYQPIVKGVRSERTARKGPTKRASRSDFDDVTKAVLGDEMVAVVEQLVTAVRSLGGFESISTSSVNPAMYLNFRTAGTDSVYWPILLRPRQDKLIIRMQKLKRHPVFADPGLRQQLILKVGDAAKTSVSGNHDGAPWVPLTTLQSEGVIAELTDVLSWVRDTANGLTDGSGTTAPTA